jgi:hypothetical protein
MLAERSPIKIWVSACSAPDQQHAAGSLYDLPDEVFMEAMERRYGIVANGGYRTPATRACGAVLAGGRRPITLHRSRQASLQPTRVCKPPSTGITAPVI